MSLEVNIGKRGNILEVGPDNADQASSVSFNFKYMNLRLLFLDNIKIPPLEFFRLPYQAPC